VKCIFYVLQDPGILQRLQHTVAAWDDIFLINFGRWHYTNCRGLEVESYRKSLHEVGALYQVRSVYTLKD
jgi:hypothetical protein